MKIRTGVFLCNLLAMFMIALTIVLLLLANNTFNQIQDIREGNKVLLGLADELRASSKNLTENVRLYATTSNKSFKEQYNNIVAVRGGSKARPSDAKVAPNEKIALLELLKIYGVSSEEYALVEQANNLSNTLITLETESMGAVEGKYKDDTGAYTITNSPDSIVAIDLVFGALYRGEAAKIMVPLDDFAQKLDARTEGLVKEKQAALNVKFILVAICMGISLIVAIASYIIVRNRVVVPLEDTTQFAEHIANGDLENQIQILRPDEIGILRATLNTLVSNLREKLEQVEQKTIEANNTAKEATMATESANSALADVQKNADHMNAISLKLEDTIGSLSEITLKLEENISISAIGADTQAQSITETVTAMDEMNATVVEVAQSASFAADISNQTKHKANNGELVVNKLIDSISSVYESSNTMKNDIKALLEHAQNVSSIMNVISDIADQTNLLALNAAIEAARAGDAGRGFAVVADEVRKLAEKTMASTTGVANAINAIQTSVTNSTKQVEITVQDVERATTLASECGASLKEIVSMADSSADQVRAIATASEEQSATTEEIAKAIIQVNNIASATTERMSEAAQVTNSLSQQNSILQGLIIELRQKK